jgi:hypothetical protein
MRYAGLMVAALVVSGCTESSEPTSLRGGGTMLLAVGSDGAPPIVLNSQLRSENEIPTSTSESQGHSQAKVLADGTIESDVMINNLGREVVRFCHIHVINTAAGTGPVVWFLTPTGVTLQNSDRIIRFRQNADYVNNAVFGADTPENAATALEALLADPTDFYVNCHSNAFPPGFIRGNLP